MHHLVATDSFSQDFQWKIAGITAPLYFTKFDGVLRNPDGGTALELTNEHFLVTDAEEGLFKLFLGREDLEIAFRNAERVSMAIYGTIEGLNRSIICKGTISQALLGAL